MTPRTENAGPIDPPGRTTVRAAALVLLSLPECWENFLDLARAKDYVPGLTDTVVTTEAKSGLGASRIVSHAQFGDMNETVIAWDEGRGMTIRLHKGDKPATPFKEAEFRYEFRPTNRDDQCEIHTSLSYVLRGGPLGRLADTLFLKKFFRRNVLDTAVCLAENYRTNEPVDHSLLPDLRRNSL